MKYTQIPSGTFQNLQMNAGILVDSFDPANGTIGNLLGATTGGINFRDNVTYTDYGADIDNCPKNTKELKKIDAHEVTMGGTFVTIDANGVKGLVGAADIDGADSTHIIPRNKLKDADFTTLWWIGDYSDQNTGDDAGFLAIKLKNALNSDGFQIRSTDKAKGQFAFNYMGHYSMSAQNEVPYEIYVKHGVSPSVTLSNSTLSLTAGGNTATLTATTNPADKAVTWSSSDTTVATVSSAGVVTPVAAGTAIITGTITVDDESYSGTCSVTVAAGA